MFLPLGRDRRDLGRSQGARLHRDAAARRRLGTQRHALLVGASRRNGEFERGADALAAGKRAIAPEFARFASARPSRVGCGAVPGARTPAGALEPRA